MQKKIKTETATVTEVGGAGLVVETKVIVMGHGEIILHDFENDLPPQAILVEGPIAIGSDIIWRAIYVMPLFMVPGTGVLTKDEVILDIEMIVPPQEGQLKPWVITPHLEFPLSVAQIERAVGRLGDSGFQVLGEIRKIVGCGQPIPARWRASNSASTAWTQAWANRKLVHAKYLSTTADAHFWGNFI